ncbi:hypothetical protein B5F76_12605 [Desulfovibrio sp. An276]|uniref:hypothetical protein n=1 Tax=Desulfovibrio sp. An276 TaxID=1965618 RepID=UPI000B3ACD92|nr:hypothetical protein [Desulfovibrio sp. An276]OUO50081.1 hypothetical protein B5F76_12605 [Desulfovibrio sp. An276]
MACCSKTRSRLKAGDNFWVIQVTDKAWGRGVIMEIKRAANEKENLADLVAEGLGQIEKNKYDVRLVSDPSLSVVLHWNLAFFKKSCQARAIVVKADIPPLGEGEARSQPPQGIRAGTRAILWDNGGCRVYVPDALALVEGLPTASAMCSAPSRTCS